MDKLELTLEPKKKSEVEEQEVLISLDVYIPLKNIKETFEKAGGQVATDLNEVSLLSMVDVSVRFTVESALKAIFGEAEVILQQEEK
jgi:hypothetical protein